MDRILKYELFTIGTTKVTIEKYLGLLLAIACIEVMVLSGIVVPVSV